MKSRFTLALVMLALASVPAAAQQYPKLKPGLWQMSRSSDRQGGAGMPPVTICFDESVQKEMWDMGAGAMRGMCSKTDFHMTASGGTGETICNFGGSTAHSKSTMTLTGDTAYRTEVDTTFDPPMNGTMAKSHMTIDGKYLGACKPGQRPGDVTMPNGSVMNMRDMAAMRPPNAAPTAPSAPTAPPRSAPPPAPK
jgi:hypothetical protein